MYFNLLVKSVTVTVIYCILHVRFLYIVKSDENAKKKPAKCTMQMAVNTHKHRQHVEGAGTAGSSKH